jgi:hypothetical protein
VSQSLGRPWQAGLKINGVELLATVTPRRAIYSTVRHGNETVEPVFPS